jgi:predicted metalloprotease with PDZ domain
MALLASLFLFNSNSVNSQANDHIRYTVRIDKDQPRLARVQVAFTPADSLLHMAGGAEQFPKRWAHFVREVKAVDAHGHPIAMEATPDGQWILSDDIDKPLVLNYELHLDHEDHDWSGGIDGVAFVRDWSVFYSGRSLFIMNGDKRDTIEVHFEIPEDWKVSTPWPPLNDQATAFTITSFTELAQSMFFAGTHEEVLVKRDDFELLFALGGEAIIAQKEDFKNMAEGVFDYYIKLMGGTPRPPADNPFNKVVVIVSSADQTDGEVLGNSISILIQEDGEPMSKIIARFIFAHEFYHLWNGKSFYPENDHGEWFKEGVTNYYTLKALHNIGHLNDDIYLQMLSSFFHQRYITDPGIGTMPLIRGDQKHDHWGLIYSGGMLAGISQDVIIRQATNNQNSLDDLMRTLFQTYGGTSDSYSLQELQQLMTELSGIDQSGFFNTHVTGSKVIPIAGHLSTLGLNASIENGTLIVSKNEEATPLQRAMLNGFFGDISKE